MGAAALQGVGVGRGRPRASVVLLLLLLLLVVMVVVCRGRRVCGGLAPRGRRVGALVGIVVG